MTRIKSTKRALLLSALSLLMCISMLIGTTFAWFTDSVTSGINQIVAGNLDVELEYSTDMSTWNKVDADTNIFNDEALWEPGYTEVVYLRVFNIGSLALKYKLGINVADETIGKTKDNNDIRLSDYIEYGIIEDVTAAYGADERMTARADIGTAAKLNSEYEKEFALVGKTETTTDADTFALVVYMPETVGNEANHNGTDIPLINLGLSVFATQNTVEEDSFNNQYDAGAKYDEPIRVGNAAELVAALEVATPGTVVDANGVKTDMSTIATPSGSYTVLDLNAGTTIKGLTLTFGNNQPIKTNNEAQSSGKIVFENCTFLSSGFTNSVYFQSGVDAAETKLVFNNCTFAAAKVVVADNSGGGVEFNNCTFNLNDSGYSLVQCMGGIHTFNNCGFNIAGSKSIGNSPITKYGYINLYAENYNTTVTLNQCKNVPSVHRYNYNGTNTFVNNP